MTFTFKLHIATILAGINLVLFSKLIAKFMSCSSISAFICSGPFPIS